MCSPVETARPVPMALWLGSFVAAGLTPSRLKRLVAWRTLTPEFWGMRCLERVLNVMRPRREQV
jgi:hypothetical protein